LAFLKAATSSKNRFLSDPVDNGSTAGFMDRLMNPQTPAVGRNAVTYDQKNNSL